MQTEKRTWLISCLIFLAAAGFSIFAGFSIAGMTGSAKEPAKENAGKETEPEATSEAAEKELPTVTTEEPSSEETEPETLPEPVAGNIHYLEFDELDLIRSVYPDEIRNYNAAGDRDAENRPVILNDLSAELTGKFKNVRIYNGGEDNTASLIFILTAENGRNTELVLNTLLERNIKATFFVNYYYAVQNQGLIARMIEEGHEIGSLGYSLPEGGITYLDLADQQTDAMDLQEYIKDTFGYTISKYYFGYEAYSEQSVALMTQMGYEVIFFSSNYQDYSSSQVIDVGQFLMQMQQELHPNAVYCLHTVNPATIDMLPGLLDYMTGNGYSVTLIR